MDSGQDSNKTNGNGLRRKISRSLGKVLLRAGVINQRQLEQAQAYQRVRRGGLGQILVELGCVTEEEVALALTAQYGFPYLPLDHYEIDAAVLQLVPEHVARQYCLIPIYQIGNALTVAMADPCDLQAIEALELLTDCAIQAFISTPSEIQNALERYDKLRSLGGSETRHVSPTRKAAFRPAEEAASRIHQERRCTPRIASALSLMLDHCTHRFGAKIQNISVSGVSCTVTQFFGRMTKLQMGLEIPVNPLPVRISCQGVVVRTEAANDDTQPRYILAIAFSGIAEESRVAIADYVQRLQTLSQRAVMNG